MPRKRIDPVAQRHKELCVEVMRIASMSDVDVKAQWYGAYAVVACKDLRVAWTVAARLKRVDQWTIETRPGRYNKVKHYIKVTFK